MEKEIVRRIRLFLQLTVRRVNQNGDTLHNWDLSSFLDGMNHYLEYLPERFTAEMVPWDFLYESLFGSLEYE